MHKKFEDIKGSLDIILDINGRMVFIRSVLNINFDIILKFPIREAWVDKYEKALFIAGLECTDNEYDTKERIIIKNLVIKTIQDLDRLEKVILLINGKDTKLIYDENRYKTTFAWQLNSKP